MIAIQDIVNLAQSALDAEGFGRYDYSRDYQPAISYAQSWVVNAFSSVLGEKKFPEENLSDLILNQIYKTNQFSRFVLDDGTNDVWTILNISLNPTIYPDTAITQPDLTKSVYSSSHSFVKAYKSANRMNVQEVNINRLNPFSAGNEVTTCFELQEFGYKLYTNYQGGYNPSTTTDKMEIEILPSYANKVLACEYIKKPSDIVNQSGNIEFPTVLTDLIVMKTLNFLSYKRGETVLAQATDKEISQLVSLMS